MKRRIFTPDEIEYIMANYPSMRSDKMAEKLGCALYSIYNAANRLHLKKSEEFLLSDESGRLNKKLANVGKPFRFTPGHVPANKGQKMSEEVKQKVARTFFQKGHLPANTSFDGDIRIRDVSKGKRYRRPYKYIRVSKANWRMLQVYNWENLYGPIPKDKIIVARDGDTLNCDPSNWMMVDRATHLDRNSGRSELTDKYVINKLSPRDRELRSIIATSPELINVKRNQLKLRREINEHA
jgi:hypothetical protein